MCQDELVDEHEIVGHSDDIVDMSSPRYVS